MQTVFRCVSQNCEKQLFSFVMSAHPFACMEKLGSQSMGFREILHLCIFSKTVKIIQVSLQ